MGLLETSSREEQLNKFHLSVFSLLDKHQFPSAFETQSQLSSVATQSTHTATLSEHAFQTARKVLELEIELILGLEGIKTGVTHPKSIDLYVLTRLKKMSSSDEMQTLTDSSCESCLTPLAEVVLRERVRIWKLRTCRSIVWFPFWSVYMMRTGNEDRE